MSGPRSGNSPYSNPIRIPRRVFDSEHTNGIPHCNTAASTHGQGEKRPNSRPLLANQCRAGPTQIPRAHPAVEPPVVRGRIRGIGRSRQMIPIPLLGRGIAADMRCRVQEGSRRDGHTFTFFSPVCAGGIPLILLARSTEVSGVGYRSSGRNGRLQLHRIWRGNFGEDQHQ